MEFVLSRYHLATDELSDFGFFNKRIIFSTRTATSIMVDEMIYQNLVSNRLQEIDFKTLKTFIEKEFLIPKGQDEFKAIIDANTAAKLDEQFLSMTIQPSANCQLGCHYCGQNHTKNYANENVIEKYVERIEYLLTQKEYNGISITWYGGEPLTGYSAIRKTSKKFIDLCQSRNMTYVSDMITNGLSLKAALFEELVKESGVTNYQITLDGDAESHDKRRHTKTGDPTFEIITKNILEVVETPTYKEYNCNITIRVNIDKTNYHSVDSLIDFIKANDLQKKISIYFTAIVDFGGNDAGKDSLNKNEFAEKEIEWLLRCFENGISATILPERTYSVCMVEKQNSEVWDAFGNIYSCWEFPYSDVYAKGESLIGNLFSPKETYNANATLRNWNETLISGKTWCKTCNHLPVCGGGCPKSWYEGTPACPPFKFNYKDKLLLDYYMKKDRELKKEELITASLP